MTEKELILEIEKELPESLEPNDIIGCPGEIEVEPHCPRCEKDIDLCECEEEIEEESEPIEEELEDNPDIIYCYE